jgi:hypothetical protein
VNRILRSAALAVIALLPVTALAASPSPSLSPSLDKVLQPAPSGYTPLTATLNGEFTAHDWAVNASGASPTETENTLNTLGFVDGFGKEWSSTSLRRALIEAVMAFSGGRGAKNAMTALKKTDTADSHYVKPDTITGIDTYYGAHVATGSVFEDEFVFVKGNDLFIVIVAGVQDNVLSAAQDQTKAQFDAAPAETIASSNWPENKSSASFPMAALFGGLVVLVIVVVVVAVIAFVVLRGRRPALAPVGTYAPPPMSGAVQMSPDFNFWWDGQGWRDANLQAPPTAQRSTDGALWWDGRTWRAVPQAQQPPAG